MCNIGNSTFDTRRGSKVIFARRSYEQGFYHHEAIWPREEMG